MKTKTIKNINAILLILLLCMTAGAGTFLALEKNKFGVVESGFILGKADRAIDLGGGLDILFDSDQVEIEVNNQRSNSNSQVSETAVSMEQVSGKTAETKDQTNEKGKFSFVAIGDTDSKDELSGFSNKLDFALGKTKDYFPDFALFTGDLVRIGNEGGQQSENKVKAIRELIQDHYNNYYIAFGNHDIECGDECIGFWQKIFFDQDVKNEKHKLYHSFDYQNTHFVLLSTDYPQRYGIDEEQLKWLEEDLLRNKKVNTIVVQHVPPIQFFDESDGKCHDMSCNEQQRQKLLRIYKENNVDLVISGNENSFDHQIVEGIDFVLSGSIGNESERKGVVKGDIYVLCSVNDERISLEGINTKGQIIRKIEVK